MASVATGEAKYIKVPFVSGHAVVMICSAALWTGGRRFWLDFCVETLSPHRRWQTVGNSEETRNYLMGNLKPDEVGQLHVAYECS